MSNKSKYQKKYREEHKEEFLIYKKQYRIDNPDKVRQWHIKQYYGLTHNEWLLIWEKQNGKCAICGKSFVNPSDAHVDHNHKTDKVRGLLCEMCNRGIGHFDDNIEKLMNAIKYLNKASE